MKAEVQQEYIPFVKAFSFSLKQFRLYSERHPITQQSLKGLSVEMVKLFQKKNKISLGAMQHKLVVNGGMSSDKDPASTDLAKEFERLAIEGLTLEKGIDEPEIIKLVTLMAMRNRSIEEKGGFRNVYEANPLPHVKLSSGKFALVEEGQSVTFEDAGTSSEASTKGEGGKPLTSISDIIQRIRSDQTGGGQGQGGGQGGGTGIVLDCEKIVIQLEKNPGDFAQAAMGEAKDAQQLEQVIRRIINFLIEGLIAFLIEQGKDITKALEKLAKELEKALDRAGMGDEYDKLKNRIPEIFEEGADELRVRMMVKTFKEHPENFKGLQKMASKIFKDDNLRKRLGPSLKEDLTQAGLRAEQFDEIFDKVEEQIKKKKGRVTVDGEELEELRKKAQRFDQEVAHKVKNAVAKVEREKKVILDEKERVDSVIRNLAEGLLVVDKKGKVVIMNPAAEKLLGIKQKDKVGKPVGEGLSGQHLLSLTQGDLKDSEANVSKNVELISVNDETKRVLQASTAVIENEDGQTVGMVSVLSDVTRQKEVEDLKSKFVANVSHELRTPLVAIQKSLSVILGKEVGEVNPEQNKFLSIAYRNIDRLSRLINDLLDVSKLEAGGMNLKSSVVPVRELVKHVLSTMETWAKDKKITLKAEFSNDAVEVEADMDRLTQVLTNLVGNALKFTPEAGQITVEVRDGIKDSTYPGGDCVEIGVRDTGIGIAPEDQAKLFNKFVQVSLAQPQGVSSTGLGLAIAREIIDLHSGRIWVESEPEKGSRFAFRLPAKFHQKEVSTVTSLK